jgi:opacity protein-like surface antigen
MRYFAVSAILLVTTLAAPVSRADDDFKPFTYLTVGASRGVGLFDGTIEDAFNPLSGQVSDTWGANAHVGYRFHKWFAAEVEYEWMKDFGVSAANINFGKIETQVATANLKVVAPYGAFEPYLLVGAGAIWASLDKSFFFPTDISNPTFTMKFGAGIDYWVTPNVSLSLGAEVVTNSAEIRGPGNSKGEGIDYLTGQFGIGFRF